MARHGNFLLFLYTHISDKKAKHLQRKRKDGENLKELLIDSVEVDVMAGFAIVKDEKVYDCALRKEQIVEKMPLGEEVVPLQSPLLWCKYYRLMGRTEKAEMIEKAMER